MAMHDLVHYPFFLLLVIISFSIIQCYTCSHQDLHNNYLEEVSAYDSDQAYPSYHTAMEGGKFKDLIKLRRNVLNMKNSIKEGSTLSTSFRKVNVHDFGAKADGTDDAQAFEMAWKEACSSAEEVVLVVPQNNYLLKPIKFSGPCKSNITMEVYGRIEASDDRSDYKKDNRQWIIFDNVQNLILEGGGIIVGNGKIWWQNSCKVNKHQPCKHAPTALSFYNCNNLVVKNLKIQDAQQMHISFQRCKNVLVSSLTITSPEESPNTDGIHVTATQNILITNSVIGTGDDCISIESGSENVQAMDITCGPGHGISIGSLGSGNSKAYVSGVTVNGAKFYGTTNGVRIKTWQGGSGSASNIKFQNVEMHYVDNPIIIDQHYCDQDEPCKEQSSAVQVKNVMYKNVKGTSASHEAIKFDCSKSYPCQGILLQDVNLETERGETAGALCNNVKLAELGVVSPRCP